MCGICASMVDNGSALQSVKRGLKKLQNRGYDSIGVCILKNDSGDSAIIKKFISDTQNAMDKLDVDPEIECNIAFGHTRWATHGQKTLDNAHPHYDDKKRFIMVHNGITENYIELKKELIDAEYDFYGQTDTEVIVKYMDYLVKNNKNWFELNTIMKGSWAIVFVDRHHPDRIYFMKNETPLLIGFNENRTKIMMVSELIGFDPDIDNYYIISDLDYGYVSLNNEFRSTRAYTNVKIKNFISDSSPSPYPNWTIKEIHDQPKTITKLIYNRIRFSQERYEYIPYFPELDKIKDHKFEHIIFLGCGTSNHAAQFGVRFFKEFQVKSTFDVIDGADFEAGDIPKDRSTLLILLSQSGETKDLYRSLVLGKLHSLRTIGLINNEHSVIAREVDVCLNLQAGREHAVASTKSFTNQVVMLLLLAMWMSDENDLRDLKYKYLSALDNLSDDFHNMIAISKNEIPKFINIFDNQSSCFILGKQKCECIAKEGSLKIKEISYIHAEGYSSSSLKHGPFALIDDTLPVILLANNDKFYSKVENAAAEIKSRGSRLIYITNNSIKNEHADFIIYYNSDSLLFPLVSLVPLQILAYQLSIRRGYNPDYPRNLAKIITVE